MTGDLWRVMQADRRLERARDRLTGRRVPVPAAIGEYPTPAR